MLRPNRLALLIAGLCCFAGSAVAQLASDDLRSLLLKGAFAEAQARANSTESPPQSAAALFDQGMAAYAMKDFDRAAAMFAQAAQSQGNPDLAIRAAVAASMALSNSGDQANTCEYTSIVQPLVDTMPLLWRGWIEETRRSNNCA